MIVRDAAMASVLTVGDKGFTGGLVTLEYGESGGQHRRDVVVSDFVDGEYEVTRALGNTYLTWVVYVTGSTVAEARSRHAALLDAVQADRWFLDVDGDGSSLVWDCRAADEDAPRFFPDGSRVVTLRIPAMPRRGY